MRPQSSFAPRALMLTLPVVIALTMVWHAATSSSSERTGEHVPPPASATPLPHRPALVAIGEDEPARAAARESSASAGPPASHPPSRFRGGRREAIQRSPDLREAAMRYSRSNAPSYTVAALQANYYCWGVAGTGGTSAAEQATLGLYVPPPWTDRMNLSDNSKRIEVVQSARRRCKPPEDAPSNYDELTTHAARFAVAPHRVITDELRSMRSLDLRNLSDSTPQALYAPDPSLLITAAEHLALRVSNVVPSELNEYEVAFASTLAGHIAACQLGDLCTPDSFRMHEICLHFAACDGDEVVEAIGRLLGPWPELRALVRQYTDAVLTVVRDGRH